MDTNDEKLYHKVLVKLDIELTEKLFNHAKEPRTDILDFHIPSLNFIVE